jgi:homoserine dehydrogenase
VPQDHLLAKVDGAFNAIEVEGDLVGRVVFHGLGAGPLPTSSAVIGDILEISRRLASGNALVATVGPEDGLEVRPMAQVKTRYYIRLNVADRAGVLAQIARVLGENQISIAAVIQKDADLAARTAELVIMTHPAIEERVQRAVHLVQGLGVVTTVDNLVRVEDWPSPAKGQA